MIAAAVVVILLSLAIIYGILFDLYSIRAKKKKPNSHPVFHNLGARLAISLVSGVVAVLLMKLVEAKIPAVDDPAFRQNSSIGLSGDQTGSTVQTHCIEGDEPPRLRCERLVSAFRRTITINIEYPRRVQVNSDFSIHVSGVTNGILFTKGIHSAALYSPDHVQIRTTRECPSTMLSVYSAMRACVELTTESDRFDLVWDLTPTKTGNPIFAIKADLDQYDKSNLIYVPISFEKLFFGDVSYHFVLSEDDSLDGTVSVDYENKEVHFPIEIVTTLGVSQLIFDLLVVIVGILTLFGTLFGTGYVRILFKGKKEPEPANLG